VYRGQLGNIDLGSSDFRNFIENNLLLVDKSAFIEHVLNDSSTVLLFTRPRRMGKSLNLDMLRAFLDSNQDARGEGLFKGLYIEGSPVFAQAGSRPVIHLNFRDMGKDSYRGDFIIRFMPQLARYLRESQYSANMRLVLAEPRTYTHQLLRTLIENIHEVHGVKPFVLIDEYDKPVMDSAGTEKSDEIRGFINSLLSMALKDNHSLGKCILTGVNRIAHESMFSDLNNLAVYSVLSESVFDTDFGFTEEEVSELCKGKRLTEAREWYNGYRIGKEKVYFTFSVMSYLKYGALDNYWGRSGIVSSIRSHLNADRFDTIAEIIGDADDTSVRTNIKDRLSAEDMLGYTSEAAFYSLLVQAGYMTYDRTDTLNQYDIYLPNSELRSVWQEFILNEVYNEPAAAIVGALGLVAEPARFASAFTEFVNNKLSYFDFEATAPEKTYHIFVCGLLAASGVRFSSNRESGLGRYDVMAFLADKTIIFEFKRAEAGPGTVLASEETGLVTCKKGAEVFVPPEVTAAIESAAAKAIKQIEDRGYAVDAPAALPVYAAGIGFEGKLCSALAKRIR
jgi:hypothetical protein